MRASVAELLLLVLLGASVVFGQPNLENTLRCANSESGICRLQCQAGELSVFPFSCSLYSAIFGVTYQRCVTSMPCCYWGATCQNSCGAGQRLLSSQATCSNAAQVCCIASGLVPTAAPTPAPPTPAPTPAPVTPAPGGSVATRQGVCGQLTGWVWNRVGWNPEPRQARLLGGAVAGASDWPWMARVTYTSTRTGFCAGVLVDDDTVLTAAHCVDGVDTATMRVILGDYDLSTYDAGEETVGVARQLVPNNFRRGTRGNDFAILKLARKIGFTSRKLPACLPDPAIPLANPPQCYVAGWGVSEQGYGGPLRAMNVQLLDRATCEQQLRLVQGGSTPLPGDIICTANPPFSPSDGCLYDDGDMLVCRDVRNRWSLVGLMSEYSCGQRLPVLFTDVRRYTDFTLQLL